MAADASIYNLIRPVTPVADPLDQYGKQLKISSLMDESRLNALGMRKAEREFSESEAEAAAYRESGGDPAKLKQLLYGKGLGKQALGVEKVIADRTKADADLTKIDRENYIAMTKQGVEALRNVNEANWGQYRDGMIQQAGMFKTPEIRQVAMQVAQSIPAQFNPQYVQRSLVEGKELFTPKPVERSDGQRKWFEDSNPFTNPAILAQAPTQMQATPGEVMTDTRTRSEGAANRGVTIRGQNMTDTRARETAEAGRWTNDLTRGIQVNSATGETRPITTNGQPIQSRDDPPEFQAKSAGFADRMRKAEAILGTVSSSGKPGWMEATAAMMPGGGTAANLLRGSDRQKYVQAQQDWVRAKLRLESGAVIGEQEMAKEIETYFPQIGDEPAVIKQKAAARKTAEDAVMMNAGRAADKLPPMSAPTNSQTAKGKVAGVLTQNPDGSYNYGR